MKRVIGIVGLLIMTTATTFAQTALPVLRVTFDGTFSRGMDYVNGQMALTDTDGLTVALPAKFKTRGATAQEYMMKPSFNMKLRTDDYTAEQDSSLLNMRSCSSWILDAMAIDRICMRNRVAFDIWNDFSRLPYDTEFDGRNGTTGRFVEVYANERYLGIYCLSDRINRKLLNLKKVKEQPDGTMLMRGVLYKSGTQDIEDQNNPGYNDDFTACTVEWHNAWELTYPEDYASEALWKPLQDAIRNGRSADYVKKYFYLDNLAEYQIFIMALSVVDNWGNKNRFLSVRNINKDINDPEPDVSDRRRFVVTPWDLDTSLGGSYNGTCYNGTYTDWPVADIQKNSPYPIDCVSADKEYLSLLRQKWVEGRAGAFAVSAVRKRLEDYCDLFEKSGAWQRMVAHFDQERERPLYVNDLRAEIALVTKWYEERFHEMDRYFDISDNIVDVEASSATSVSTLYNLQGQPVRNDTAPAGIYVQAGRKIVVR